MLGTSKLQSLNDPQPPSPADFAQARAGASWSMPTRRPAWSRALIQLQALNDAYLLVVRVVDPKVFAYYQRTAARGQRI